MTIFKSLKFASFNYFSIKLFVYFLEKS